MYKSAEKVITQVCEADPSKAGTHTSTLYRAYSPIHVKRKEFLEMGYEIEDYRRICKKADYMVINIEDKTIALYSYLKQVLRKYGNSLVSREKIHWCLRHNLLYEDKLIILYAVIH